MFKKIFFLFLLVNTSFVLAQKEWDVNGLEKDIMHFETYKVKNKIVNFTLQDSVKCNLLLKIAESYSESNPDKALSYSKEVLNLSYRINYKKGIAISYNLLGKLYNGKGDFELAIKSLNIAVSINKAIQDISSLSDSYFILGQSYLFLDKYAFSVKYLNLALGGFVKTGQNAKVARVYNNLAIMYGKLDNNAEELQYYKKALAILKNEKSFYAQSLRNMISTNIGNVYSNKREFLKSNLILLENIDFVIKHNKINALGLIYLRLGFNYRELKQYNTSLDYLNKSWNCFKQIKNKSGEADALRTIGETYCSMNQFRKAEDFAQKGLKLSKQIGELESVKFAYNILANIYFKKRDFKKAYENHVLYKSVSDAMFNEQINSKMTHIQMSHEFERKQEIIENEQIKKDAILKKEALKQKRIKSIVLLSLLFLSVITLGVYMNLKRYKKQNEIIESQKDVVENQKEQIQNSLLEKETLLREIHHRVKNNLQIISSLLNMQSEEISDPKVLSSIQEGQSRVQAMSLIHQNLYQSVEMNKVDVENYLKELVDYLSKMFLGESKSITTQIETSNIHFDFDTAIPLGLIVNELVSNAFKYAFARNETGIIWIEIKAINDFDYELKVVDNGNMLPKDFDLKNSKTLGLKLVSILSKQLRGSFSVSNTGGKTSFVVLFKDLKMYQLAQK